MQLGWRGPSQNSGPSPQYPGSWIPPAQRRHLFREEINPGCPPKGGLYGLKLFFHPPGLWGLVEPWSPSSTILDPSAGKGLPAWSDGYTVTCGTEFSRSSCLL